MHALPHGRQSEFSKTRQFGFLGSQTLMNVGLIWPSGREKAQLRVEREPIL